MEVNARLMQAISRIGAADEQLIERNAAAVRAGFSLSESGQRLCDILARCVKSDRTSQIDPPEHGHRVLDSFLSLSRFQPIRVELT
jgi:hypothetical protein